MRKQREKERKREIEKEIGRWIDRGKKRGRHRDEAEGEQVQTWPVRKSLTARGQKLPEGLVRAWKRH